MRSALLLFSVVSAAFLAACGDVGGDEEDGGVFFSRDAMGHADTGIPPSSGILVAAVFDGDTISVEAAASVLAPDGRRLSDSHIRFLGIDAPEIAHPPQPADCWGPEASMAAHELLAGKFITLEFDNTHELRDQYDRILAYIHLMDDRVVNEVMLQTGNARSFRAFPHKYTDRYNMLEEQARAQHLGMWSCP